MKDVLSRLAQVPKNRVALISGNRSVTYSELLDKVTCVSQWLTHKNVNSVVLMAQNSIDWVVIDLACQTSGILLTPIPLFFTGDQFNQVLKSVKPDLILSDTKLAMELTYKYPELSLYGCRLQQPLPVEAPAGTVKITYTSGSTGVPKGVCLSQDNQWQVTRSLVDVIGIEHPTHLCLLPLPTLLENIAGVYAPLLAGGTVVLPDDDERGFKGSALVAPEKLLGCISTQQPNTLICVPELLQVLVRACVAGWVPPASLQFIAVGGSKVSAKLLQKAKASGLPVFQGYGLSECASVVSLSSSLADNDSCGKVLPHLSVELVNSEIIVKGNTFLGYLEDQGSWGAQSVRTGDLGRIENGELYLHGRKKNTLINSYGRNISPEWVEAELLATGMFLQAVVVGDEKPFCTAILVPINADVTQDELMEVVAQVNRSLPDYAKVQHPIVLCTPMTAQDGLYTDNMRPKRQQIARHFIQQINHVYSQACEQE